MKLNRKLFFDHYRTTFGNLTQEKVNAIDTLLDFIDDDAGWNLNDPVSLRQLAYTLGTFYHETARTMEPIDEMGTDERFDRLYGPQTKVGKVLGNIKPGDGAKYHGRGYVQLTGRSNYAHAGQHFHVDLIANPDLAKEPKLSYAISVAGMRAGWFTGVELSDFINKHGTSYVEARKIINGLDCAILIKGYAEQFEAILEASRVAVVG